MIRDYIKDKGISAVITTHDLACTFADKFWWRTDRSFGGLEVLNAENIKAVYSVDVEVVKNNGNIVIPMVRWL